MIDYEQALQKEDAARKAFEVAKAEAAQAVTAATEAAQERDQASDDRTIWAAKAELAAMRAAWAVEAHRAAFRLGANLQNHILDTEQRVQAYYAARVKESRQIGPDAYRELQDAEYAAEKAWWKYKEATGSLEGRND